MSAGTAAGGAPNPPNPPSPPPPAAPMEACIRAKTAGSNMPKGLADAPPAPVPTSVGMGGKKAAKGFGAGWALAEEVAEVLLGEGVDVGAVDGSPGAGNAEFPPAAGNPNPPPNGLIPPVL